MRFFPFGPFMVVLTICMGVLTLIVTSGTLYALIWVFTEVSGQIKVWVRGWFKQPIAEPRPSSKKPAPVRWQRKPDLSEFGTLVPQELRPSFAHKWKHRVRQGAVRIRSWYQRPDRSGCRKGPDTHVF